MSKVSLWPRLIGVLVGLALGVYYIGFVILGYHVGSTGYQVIVQVPTAAGVYADGTVTYRGVQVGKIERLDLSDQGVDVVLHIDRQYKIPADAEAHVKMLSALGEQYVNLVPAEPAGRVYTQTQTQTQGSQGSQGGQGGQGNQGNQGSRGGVRAPGGPYLHDGSVIPRSRTTVPIQIGEVLTSANRLLSSLDPDDVRSVVSLLANAFGDVAPELKRLVKTGQDLTEALIRAKAGTRTLILDGRTVLRAGNATSGEFKTYIAALDTLSRQFAHSDRSFSRLLHGGSGAAGQLEDLLRTESGPFKQFLSGTGSIGTALSEDSPATRALFAVLPSVSSKLGSAARGGELLGSLRLNDGQPVCSYGSGVLPLPDAGGSGGSPMGCPVHDGLQMRGPQQAPGGAR